MPRWPGSAPVSRMIDCRRCEMSACSSWQAPKLTAMRTSGRPARAHATACSQTLRNSHSPISTISPESSAIGTNSAGETGPNSAWSQRSSVSRPMTVPSRRSTCGWKWNASSRRAKASASAAASRTRRAVASAVLALGSGRSRTGEVMAWLGGRANGSGGDVGVQRRHQDFAVVAPLDIRQARLHRLEALQLELETVAGAVHALGVGQLALFALRDRR